MTKQEDIKERFLDRTDTIDDQVTRDAVIESYYHAKPVRIKHLDPEAAARSLVLAADNIDVNDIEIDGDVGVEVVGRMETTPSDVFDFHLTIFKPGKLQAAKETD